MVPVLNSTTAGTRYTNDGIVCIRSRAGRITRSAPLFIDISIPTGNPKTRDMDTATITRLIVSSIFSQRPKVPIKNNIAPYATPVVIFLLILYPKNTTNSISTIHGTEDSKWLIA